MSEAQIHHLIITRFSVNTKLAGRMRKKDASDTYLQYRMRLFRLFCLPSIQAQRCKAFRWFVLFGANTPDWLRIKLDAYEQDGDFIPIYASSFGMALDEIREWVRINAKPGDQLLTTRFDNDDALSSRHVEVLQSQCKPEYDLRYFCPRNGQQVTVRSDEPNEWRYFRMTYPANPFVSMLERVTEEPPKMIYHCKHGSVKRKAVGAPVQALTFYPSWMQILHGKNLGNGLWTRSKTEKSYDDFPFLKEYYDFGIPSDLRSQE